MPLAHAKYPDLDGRAALVTGASSGIGLGVAEAMLEQGMRVGVHYRSGRAAAEELCARHPGRAVALGADLSTEEGCAQLARGFLDVFGRERGVHVLVHSAGIWTPGPIRQMTRENLESIFRVNVFSGFYLARELADALGASGHGAMVFIGSTAGQRGEAGHSHYAASKGAMQSMVLALAVELAPSVRVNLVSPGWVRTPMTEANLEVIGPTLLATLPNRRVAEVADVAAAVLYLASDSAGHLIGQDIGVSGGALLVVPRGQLKPV